jgi:integrase
MGRRTRLALKFQLATMLRGGELIAAHTSELFDLDGDAPCFRIPARRVKKRRIVEQPLSDLAVEIIKEALATNVAAGQKKTNENNIQKSAGPANAAPHGFVFESPMYPGQPLHRSALATALRGDRKTKGLCELLGLQPLRPHDLRRTSATLAGELGYSESAIAKTLDHAITKDDGEKINRVTGIYNQSRRAKQKRAVLDGIAAELRRIIGEPTVTVADPDELRLAA